MWLLFEAFCNHRHGFVTSKYYAIKLATMKSTLFYLHIFKDTFHDGS